MADHVMKKYKALVEKTIYVSEEIEILAETERQAEELLEEGIEVSTIPWVDKSEI